MVKVTVRIVLENLRHQIQRVSVQLAKGDNQLNDVAVWTVAQIEHGREETQRAVNERSDALHTDNKRVGTGTRKYIFCSNHLLLLIL